MDRARMLSLLARSTVLVALVVIESLVLERSDLVRGGLLAAQELVARSAGAVVSLLGVENTVEAIRIQLSGISVDVTEECLGVDVGLFLATAIFVHPAPLRSKLLGAATALSVVLVLNWVRVVSLALLAATARPWFDLAHYYGWPGLVLVTCIAIFLGWARHLPQQRKVAA